MYNDKSLGGSLILCPFSKIITFYPIQVITCIATEFWPNLAWYGQYNFYPLQEDLKHNLVLPQLLQGVHAVFISVCTSNRPIVVVWDS